MSPRLPLVLTSSARSSLNIVGEESARPRTPLQHGRLALPLLQRERGRDVSLQSRLLKRTFVARALAAFDLAPSWLPPYSTPPPPAFFAAFRTPSDLSHGREFDLNDRFMGTCVNDAVRYIDYPLKDSTHIIDRNSSSKRVT